MFVINKKSRSALQNVVFSDLHCQSRPYGYSAVELVIVLAIVGFTACCLLMVLPGGRETARQAHCQKNLMQIGIGVQLYDQLHQRYPASQLSTADDSVKSPIQLMLESLSVDDFRDLRIGTELPKAKGAPLVVTRMPGLICPSDSYANSPRLSTGISYRANVGDDFGGTNGPFSSILPIGSHSVEESDGLSYTAGFAERLIGTGQDRIPDQANYLDVPNPITALDATTNIPGSKWLGDAGSSWAKNGWRSAIYSHAIPPNATKSRIAHDGQTAAMSASSAHPARVHVWMLDGSLRVVLPTIDLKVWKGLGSTQTNPPTNDAVQAGLDLKAQSESPR